MSNVSIPAPATVRPPKPVNIHMKYLQSQQPELQLQYLTNQAFWLKMKEEMLKINADTIDPLRQVLDPKFVQMEMRNEFQGSPDIASLGINADAPITLAKACELFILELTLRSWQGIHDGDRHNLKVDDIRKALESTDIYDLFLSALPPTSTGGDADSFAATTVNNAVSSTFLNGSSSSSKGNGVMMDTAL